MIRYLITEVELEARIDMYSPGWKGRAASRAAIIRKLRRYEEATGIWGEIKSVYMELQHDKCAYCERKLEGEPYGRIEHDLEHFRPKSSVTKWPSGKYKFSTGDGWSEGYYLLAYSIFNYATSCKVCNSTLKRDYFPIYGNRGPQSDHPRVLLSERPLLIYPLGDLDDDPQDLIAFVGIIPIARTKSGYKSYRGRVTVDFFALERREHLREERARQLQGLWIALELADSTTDPTTRADALNAIDWLQSRSSPHSSCVQSFHALYKADPSSAHEVYVSVRNYLTSRSL